MSLSESASSRGVNPRVAWMTVNRSCNFRCGWCYAKDTGYHKEKELSLKLAIDIVAMIKALRIKNITVIGGEPTLWKPLLEFNQYCKANGLQTTLVTNAAQFGIDRYWNNYRMAPNSRVGISIKGYDKNSFEDFTGVRSFDQTRQGIERAVQFFNCGVSVVYSSLCSDKLIELAVFAASCGAKSLGISPCTPSFSGGTIDTSCVMSPADIVCRLVDDYPRLNELFKGRRLNISVKLPLCIWPREFVNLLIEREQITTTCQLQHRSGLLFDTDGTLVSCNSLFGFPLGRFGQDFHDSNSLLKFLGEERVVEFYDRITSYPSDKCKPCDMYKFCAGGCPLFYGQYSAEKAIPGW
ncbi:MAG: radical SAM protein [Sterolibacterium sp.]